MEPEVGAPRTDSSSGALKGFRSHLAVLLLLKAMQSLVGLVLLYRLLCAALHGCPRQDLLALLLALALRFLARRRCPNAHRAGGARADRKIVVLEYPWLRSLAQPCPADGREKPRKRLGVLAETKMTTSWPSTPSKSSTTGSSPSSFLPCPRRSPEPSMSCAGYVSTRWTFRSPAACRDSRPMGESYAASGYRSACAVFIAATEPSSPNPIWR